MQKYEVRRSQSIKSLLWGPLFRILILATMLTLIEVPIHEFGHVLIFSSYGISVIDVIWFNLDFIKTGVLGTTFPAFYVNNEVAMVNNIFEIIFPIIAGILNIIIIIKIVK